MNPDPIPTPGGTASAAAQAGAGVWNQSSQLAQLANSSTGLAPSMSFLVGVLLFLLAVAVGWLAIAQSFSAGKGNTQKTRQQGVVMASAIGWGTGFGRFQAVPRNEGKVQRNPKTGERVPVVPGNRVRFMAYDQLIDVVNGGDNGGRPVTRRHSPGTSGDVPS